MFFVSLSNLIIAVMTLRFPSDHEKTITSLSCSGLRMTSCKSGKDRTGMSVTLEQVNILSREFDLADNEYERALDSMRR